MLWRKKWLNIWNSFNDWLSMNWKNIISKPGKFWTYFPQFDWIDDYWKFAPLTISGDFKIETLIQSTQLNDDWSILDWAWFSSIDWAVLMYIDNPDWLQILIWNWIWFSRYIFWGQSNIMNWELNKISIERVGNIYTAYLNDVQLWSTATWVTKDIYIEGLYFGWNSRYIEWIWWDLKFYQNWLLIRDYPMQSPWIIQEDKLGINWPELIVNWDFEDTSSWLPGENWDLDNWKAEFTNLTNPSQSLKQNWVFEIWKTYDIHFDVESTHNIWVQNWNHQVFIYWTTWKARTIWTADATSISFKRLSNWATGYIDNVSAKESTDMVLINL